MKQKYKFSNFFGENTVGILLAVLIGIFGYGIKVITKSSFADPLLISMIIGIIFTTAIEQKSKIKPGFVIAPRVFIPIGVAFYAVKNLNFVKIAKVESPIILLLVIIMVVYFATVFLLGKLLKQKKKITCLIATGSAICGASAIAITSPVVEAEPDDISISLLSVALSGLVGLLIIFPFFATLLDISNKTYGLLSGSVLQFTGFVKAAVGSVPFLKTEIPAKELASLALSVKSARYLGLLIAIPLFASLVKRKFYIPWFLWAFLIAGLLGTWIYVNNKTFYVESLIPFIKPIYNISWSIAMAAVGLNADAKQLLSNNGTKALIMAFSGFIAASIVFFIGLSVIRLF